MLIEYDFSFSLSIFPRFLFFVFIKYYLYSEDYYGDVDLKALKKLGY